MLGDMIYILATTGSMLFATYGPFSMTMRECNAHVELWVKLYQAYPPIGKRVGNTYQCVNYQIKKRGKV